MTGQVPGKSRRKGISLVKIMDMFPSETAAEVWFAAARWPEGPHCPHCGSTDVQMGAKHKMPYRCREKACRKRFSVRIGTVMEGTNLSYREWAITICLCLTSLNGVSSMKLHRDLNITQKLAWHLAHRIREGFAMGDDVFSGPVKADEADMGGLRKNVSRTRRKGLAGTGRGAVGTATVAGASEPYSFTGSGSTLPAAKLRHRTVKLVRSDYQPSKAELEEPIDLRRSGGPWPAPDEVARAIMKSAKIKRITQPK